MDAPAADLDAGTDLEEFEPDLAQGGRSQIGAAQHLGPQNREYEMGESREPEPELVGGHPARAGAIGKEVLLCLLDAVFPFLRAHSKASRRVRELQSGLRARRGSLQREAVSRSTASTRRSGPMLSLGITRAIGRPWRVMMTRLATFDIIEKLR